MGQSGFLLAVLGTVMIFVGFAPGFESLLVVGAVVGTFGVFVMLFASMGKDEDTPESSEED